MHKAVIFDLGRVLVNLDYAHVHRALEKLCPYEAPEISRRLAASGLPERFETGLIEPIAWAERHAAVIRRFGRYPHRNAILGRDSTAKEIEFLAKPGSGF